MSTPNTTRLDGEHHLTVDYDHPAVNDAVPAPAAPSLSTPAPDDPGSAAVVRFRSCRWRKPPEDGEAECCTHRDVLPLTGTKGFDPEAWCPGCAFYKLRRTPKRSY
jgi:hypothetical protein